MSLTQPLPLVLSLAAWPGSDVGRIPEEDLLARAAEDWVHPAELLGIVRQGGQDSPASLRDAAVELLDRLLDTDLVIVGDVHEAFVPWEGTPDEVLRRVAETWAACEDPFVTPGELFWVDTTPAGQAIGEAVWAREAQEG